MMFKLKMWITISIIAMIIIKKAMKEAFNMKIV